MHLNISNFSTEQKNPPKKDSNKNHKKHIIDAIHLGPYHHGHSWGTVNAWPGISWPWSGGWGVGAGFPAYHGWTGYPSFGIRKSKIGGKSNGKTSKEGDVAEKRWWPGNMGGWGGWGWGNWGYPGWGWGIGYHAGPWGYVGHRSEIPKENKKQKSKNKALKRFLPFPGVANRPWYGGWHGFDVLPGYGLPWLQYPEYGYEGPHGFGGYAGSLFDGYLYNNHGGGIGFGGWGYPGNFLGYGHGFGYGGGFGHGYGFLRSDVHKKGSKSKKEENAEKRHHVTFYHPGHYGWGGTVYRGSGVGGILPLMGAFGPFGHALSPLGPYGVGVWGPFYHKSDIPRGTEDPQSRQVGENSHKTK